MLKIGDPVPDSLQRFKGKKLVLYFYPKDDTPGCTAEACSFRDNVSEIQALEATVVGVSKDPLKSHEKFKEKYSLPFELIADEDLKLAQAFGVWKEKSMYGKSFLGMERSTFLIDENGKLVKEWRKVKVKGHTEEILEALKAMQ